MAVIEPTLDQLLNSDPPSKSTRGAYRQIDVQDDASLSAKIRTLDPEQRFSVDKVMDFARRVRRAENQPGKNERPTPPHLVVLGNGGTGKSHVIEVVPAPAVVAAEKLQERWNFSDTDHHGCRGR